MLGRQGAPDGGGGGKGQEWQEWLRRHLTVRTHLTHTHPRPHGHYRLYLLPPNIHTHTPPPELVLGATPRRGQRKRGASITQCLLGLSLRGSYPHPMGPIRVPKCRHKGPEGHTYPGDRDPRSPAQSPSGRNPSPFPSLESPCLPLPPRVQPRLLPDQFQRINQEAGPQRPPLAPGCSHGRPEKGRRQDDSWETVGRGRVTAPGVTGH